MLSELSMTQRGFRVADVRRCLLRPILDAVMTCEGRESHITSSMSMLSRRHLLYLPNRQQSLLVPGAHAAGDSMFYIQWGDRKVKSPSDGSYHKK